MFASRWSRSVAWLTLVLIIPAAGAAETEQQAPEPEPAMKGPLASQAVFLDIAAAGERTVAVGERGIIVYSDDAGKTWTQAEVPVRGTLTAVTFLDDRSGFAVGHDSIILRTADAGETWDLVQFDPPAENVYLNVRFRTPQWGYVVGTNGQLLVTRDGGESWQAQTLAVEDWYQNHLFDIVWNDEITLVAAEKGVIYRSPDGLSDWEPVESPYEGSYFGAETVAGGRFLLYGMSGRVYLSDPAGEQWERVRAPTEQFLYDAQSLEDGRTVVVGAGGVYGVVDPQTGVATLRQRDNRVGLTAVLVRGERVVLASEAGGILTLSREEILPD